MSDDPLQESETGRPASARVWVLVGQTPGDNAQVANLARAVGLPVLENRIGVLPGWETGKPLIRPSLDHVDRARSGRARSMASVASSRASTSRPMASTSR